MWRENTNKLPQQKTYEQFNTLPNTNIFTPRLWMLGRLDSFSFWDGLPGKSPLFHCSTCYGGFLLVFVDPGHFPMSAAFRTCRAFPAFGPATTAVSGQVDIQTKTCWHLEELQVQSLVNMSRFRGWFVFEGFFGWEKTIGYRNPFSTSAQFWKGPILSSFFNFRYFRWFLAWCRARAILDLPKQTSAIIKILVILVTFHEILVG